VFSLLCLAYVVQVSLPYNKVLMTQALYTAIFVDTVRFFCPDAVFKMGHDFCCYSYPLAGVRIKGETFGYNGTKVSKLFDNV